MRHIVSPSLSAAFLLLSACAGGGGGVAAPATAGVPANTHIGSASDQGVTVQVVRRSGAPVGQVQARIIVLSDAGEPAPTSVSCWLGTAYEPPAEPMPATAVAGEAAAWDASLPLPSHMPGGTAVWVRVERADGSRLEMGRGIFVLP